MPPTMKEAVISDIHDNPEIVRRLAASGAFEAVFSAHDHRRYQHRIGETLWANPGEIMVRYGEPSFGIYETTNGEFNHVDLA